ncbi:lipocalin family protein [Spirosoma flavum]|uniref:Lipocalin family protein n=1 Tax=Spirosoma flavum TaxID=2048557 RepID=A0ABW6AE15_9BACT
MKNLCPSRLLAWSLLVTIPLWFSSCKKSDDPTTTTPTTTVEGSYKVNALKVSPKVGGLYEDLLAAAPLILTTTCLSDITLTFQTGGSITTDNPTTCQKSTIPPSTITGIDASSKWALSGNILTITKTDGTKTNYTVLSSGTILQLQWQDSQDYLSTGTKVAYTYTMDLKKQ